MASSSGRQPDRRRAFAAPAAALALALAALAGGWWLGQRQAPPAADPRRAGLEREAGRLALQLERGDAAEGDRQRLLELLVGLGRKDEAVGLVETMADREPERWSLRLLLAELRRDGGDRRGAERELRQLLSRRPQQVEALQLLALLLLEQGRGAEAEGRVRSAYAAASRPELQPEALGLGLLLAELQQKRGQSAAAAATCLELAQGFPRDQRPLLALALLRQEQGDLRGARAALTQARQRSADPAAPDPRLDRLAASWGLRELREQAAPRNP
jgi:predicted Zn-dependent protease